MAGAGNGNAKNGSRGNGGDKGKKRFTISLSLPGMVVAVAVLLFGLAWTFVIGVLVGRGYKPESAVPEIAALMPGAGNATREEAKTLKPEDLHYLDDLTKMPAPPPASLTAKPEKPAEKPADKAKAPDKTADKSADKPSDTAAARSADALAEKLADRIAPEKPGTPAPAKPAAQPAPQSTSGSASSGLDTDASGQVYRYVYQVAAFPDQFAAQEFRTKLAGLGLGSGLEQTTDGKGRAWYRVTLLMPSFLI